MNIGTMVIGLLLDDKGVDAGLKRARLGVRSFNADVVAMARSVDDQLSSAFRRVTAAATAFGTAATLIGAGFEKRMSEVAAVSQSTAEEMAALTDKAREIGETTAFSASQAADAMISLARNGLTANQVLGAARATTVLAGAGNIELAASADLVAATLAQFSLKASEAGRVADVFTVVTQKSRFSLGTLAEAMKYAGTTGAALGLSLEETSAAVAQFVDLGLDGSTAGTNFREAMLSLVNPTNQAQEALADLGLTAEDVNPQIHGFAGVMETLGAKGLDAAHAMDIIGLRAGANVAKIATNFQTGASKFDALQRSLVESAGVAEATYATMMDNVAGRFAILRSSFEELLLVVFDGIKGPLSAAMGRLNDRVQALSVVFRGLGGETSSALGMLADALLYVIDALVRLTPYLREVGALMLGALVVARGIRYVAAAQELAKVVGVDLVGAFAKLATVVLSLEALPALLVGLSSAGIVAGIGVLVAAFARLVTQITGSADAARRLRAELDAVAAIQASDTARATDLGRILEQQQAMIRLRQQNGAALSDEERALLRMDGAQAAVLERQGELIAVGDQLRLATALDADTRRDQAKVLAAQAEEYDRLAAATRYLAANYREAGVSGTINDLVNAPLLASASEALGRTVSSYDDLFEAAAEYSLRADRERDIRAKLLNGIALEAGERVELTGAIGVQSLGLEEAAEAAKAEAAALKKTKAELKALIDVAGQRAGGDAQAFGWLPTRAASDLSRGSAIVVDSMADTRAQVDQLNASFAAVNEQPGRMERALASLGGELQRLTTGAGRAALDLVGRLGDAFVGLGQSILDNAVGAFQGLFQSIIRLVGPLFAVGDFVSQAISDQADAQAALAQATDRAAEAERALRQARRDGSSEDAIRAAAEDARQAQRDLEEATAAASMSTSDLAEAQARATADQIRTFVTTFAAALPTLLEEITAQLPTVIDAIVASIPRITDAVVAQVPVVLREIADAAPRVIRRFADSTPILLRAILDQVPTLIDALTEGVVMVIKSLPSIADVILQAVPAIVEAATAALPDVIEALIEALLGVIQAVADNLEPIIFAVLQSIPTVVAAVIDAIPQVVQALIDAGPEIAKGFVEDLVARLTDANWEDLFQMLTGMSLDAAEQMGRAFLSIVTLGLSDALSNPNKGAALNLDENGIPVPTASGSATVRDANAPPQSPADARRAAADWLANLFRGGRRRAASGIQWAPATMTTVIEPGEAVIDAQTNARRLAGYQLAAPAPMQPAGATGSVEVVVALDGEVVDAAMFGSLRGGRMPRLQRALRAPGVKPGIGRGRWDPQTG